MRAHLLTALLLLSTIPYLGMGLEEEEYVSHIQEIESFEAVVRLMPGEDLRIHIDPNTYDITPEPERPVPPPCMEALKLVPEWLGRNLSLKFSLLDPEVASDLALLMLNSPDERYVDEIAFVIAHCSVETLTDRYFFNELVTDNARLIYETAPYLDYVEIVEKEDCTTLMYNSSRGGVYELDPQIYYWFVVHPDLSDELPTYVDPEYNYVTDPPFDRNYGVPPPEGRYWREFLYNYNKSGQPLLKDSLSSAETVLDAIKAVNGWVSASMEFTSDNERPIQPVRIYEKGFGRCGEHQDLRGAAARCGLIPVLHTSNTAEDHVWNEFYDTEWIHWDGSIDNPLMYERGWGKTISSVWNLRGDGYTWPVTERYSEEVCTVDALVLDSEGLPVDAAEVDILTENFYQQDLLTTSISGTADVDGMVSFTLGDSRNYWGRADGGDLGEDPSGPLEGPTPIATDSEPDGAYNVTFDLPRAADTLNVNEEMPLPESDVNVHIDFWVLHSVVRGTNSHTGDHFESFSPGGNIDLFVASDANMRRYDMGLPFDAWGIHSRAENGTAHLPLAANLNTVLSNGYSQGTTKYVLINVTVAGNVYARIAEPGMGDEVPQGGVVEITGEAWSPLGMGTLEISIGGGGWTPVEEYQDRAWIHEWDTEGLELGDYRISVRGSDGEHEAEHSIDIELVDVTPPTIQLEATQGTAFRTGQIAPFEGMAYDNHGIGGLSYRTNGGASTNLPIDREGGFSFSIDTSYLEEGENTLEVICRDVSYNTAIETIALDILEGVPPEVDLLSPMEGGLYRMGEELPVRLFATDNRGLSLVRIGVDGGTIWSGSLSGTSDTVERGVPTTGMAEGAHTFSAEVEDGAGNVERVEVELSLDGTYPVLELDPYLDIHAAGMPLHISGYAKDDNGLSSIEAIGEAPGDHAVIFSPTQTRVYSADIGWEIPGSWFEDGKKKVEVRVMDLVGNEVSHEIDLQVDGQAPMLEVSEPPGVILRGKELNVSGSVDDDIGMGRLLIRLNGVLVIDEETAPGPFWFSLGSFIHSKGALDIDVTAVDKAGNERSQKLLVHVVTDATDTDGDGIPDIWEYENGLDPFVPDSDQDPDQDGHTNLEEYLGKDGRPGGGDSTDPNSPSSYPAGHKEKGFPFALMIAILVLFLIAGVIAYFIIRKRGIT